MPGPLLHVGATVLCTHGGQAQPTSPFPRVLVSGQPIVTLAAPYVVAACPFPSGSGGPCVTGQWVTGTVRVLAGGLPVVMQSSQSVCAPTGTPMTPTVVQTRVIGT